MFLWIFQAKVNLIEDLQPFLVSSWCLTADSTKNS